MEPVKRWILCGAFFLAGCTPPGANGIQTIVGAKLTAAPGAAPIEYSVVVIENGKIARLGPQSSTPVPKGSKITSGLGMTIQPVPGGPPLEPGRPADLILKVPAEKGAIEREMRDGEWIH